MKFALPISGLLSLITLSEAHMEMSWPPPFRSRHNRFTTNIDYNLIDPLRADGQNYPCKGYHSLIGSHQGQSVVDWEPGQSYNFSIIGTAHHDGGSCQASLSYDGGNSWKVIKSYHGGCPLRRDWEFTLPTDTPTGDALFAWSWFNRIGNREMYMNCARITIKPAERSLPKGSGRAGNMSMPDALTQRSDGVSFWNRPDIFTANINNGCSTVEGFDVVFPEPGQDISGVSDRPLGPRGNCGAGAVASSSSIRTVVVPTSTRPANPPAQQSTSSASSSAPSSNPQGTVGIWQKCGGLGWTGPTTCDDGLICDEQSTWYHQCIPAPQARPTSSSTSSSSSTTAQGTTTQSTSTAATGGPGPNAPVSPVWAQCGGASWTGPTQCAPGLRCNRQSQWYSQCVPA